MRSRILYERLVSQFPTSGRYWRLFIEQEVNDTWSSLLTYLYFVVKYSINSRVILCITVARPIAVYNSEGIMHEDNKHAII